MFSPSPVEAYEFWYQDVIKKRLGYAFKNVFLGCEHYLVFS